MPVYGFPARFGRLAKRAGHCAGTKQKARGKVYQVLGSVQPHVKDQAWGGKRLDPLEISVCDSSHWSRTKEETPCVRGRKTLGKKKLTIA